MTKSLMVQKKDLVRDVIYNAALDLFVEKGFSNTTIDDIAKSVGVSRASFFRYFATKDDLLYHSTVEFSKVLIAAVNETPKSTPPLELVRRTALAGFNHSVALPRIRQVINVVSALDPAAKQAHRAKLGTVESLLSDAISKKLRKTSKENNKPRILAIMTLMVIDLSLASWYMGEFGNNEIALKNVFSQLEQIFHVP